MICPPSYHLIENNCAITLTGLHGPRSTLGTVIKTELQIYP